MPSPTTATASAPAPGGETRIARTRAGHVWGEVWRLAAALLFGLLLWGVTSTAQPPGSPGAGPVDTGFGFTDRTWVWWDVALGVTACLLLLLRRRWPLTVTLVTTCVNAVSLTASGASTIALISLATTRRWRAIVVATVVSLLERWVSFMLFRSEDRGPYWSEVMMAVLTLGLCIAVGFYIGERRAFVGALHDRAETAEREQTMRIVQARLGERSRIAREMHDVLAHRISLVAMHSGALTYRTDLTPAEVAEAAEVIRANANLALTELREVLGVLRDLAEDPPSTAGTHEVQAPQPTLADLDQLIAECGARVDLEVTGDLAAVPTTLSRNAFRIVQECLTNARKHASGQWVAVTVQVGTAPGELVIRARNPTTSAAEPTVVGSGLGLIGLTERAVLSGGELTYGLDRRGDFIVTARLPLAT